MFKKRGIFFLLTVIVVTISFSLTLFAQVGGKSSYKKGRIFFKNGATLEGKNLFIDGTTATITMGMDTKSYNLSDIQQILAKEGKGGKYAMVLGGGCLALGILSYVAGDDETFEESYGGQSKSEASGQYFAGLAIWVGCLAGVGYLIGNAADSWTTVYVGSTGSLIEEQNSNFTNAITPDLLLGHYIGD